MMIYPAIDLKDGQVVRLYQGKFDATTVYSSDPISVAQAYKDKGSTYLHVVDLTGALDGVPHHKPLIEKMVETGLKIQCGGGIRSVSHARSLCDAGVERIILGSIAAENVEETSKIIKEIGPDAITLGLDVNLDETGTPIVAIRGWKEASSRSFDELIETYQGLGVNRLLCTDISKDGTLTGPNIDLYNKIMSRHPKIELLASGGVKELTDISALKSAGVHGVIVGKAIYENKFTVEELLKC